MDGRRAQRFERAVHVRQFPVATVVLIARSGTGRAPRATHLAISNGNPVRVFAAGESTA
jgi:hypothetical protein